MRILPFVGSLALLGSTLFVLPAAADPSRTPSQVDAVAEAATAAGTTTSPAAPHPVSPVVNRTPLDLTAAGGATTQGTTNPSSTVERETTQRFSTIGFSYDRGAATPQIEVRVREDGTWSDWYPLGLTDAGPDADTAEAARASGQAVTEPLSTASADAFTVRVTPAEGAAPPTGLTAVTIDPGTSAADAQLTAAPTATIGVDAPAPAPAIISRAGWGADENLRLSQGCDVTYNATIKVGFVHHTASTNNYNEAGAAAQVRGMYAYHVNSNGWCDFGYNFLVDKFGRVYEGRYGGVDRPVSGAHTGGFNKDSFGVSALGNYDIAEPSDAMVGSIARVLGWKLGLHHRNPLGQDTLVSAGGGTDKWPVGQTVTFNVVSGHRDAGNTVCPGRYLYPRLAGIRTVAAGIATQTDVRIGNVVPDQQVAYQGGPVSFGAVMPSAQPWDLTLVDQLTGAVVRTWSGNAERGALGQTWDLTDSGGNWVRGGLYRWTLRTPVGGLAVGQIEVLPPSESVPTDGFTGSVSDAGFTAITPVRVYDSRDGGQPLGQLSSRAIQVVGGPNGVPGPAGVKAVAVNVTVVNATRASYLSARPAGAAPPPTSSLNYRDGDTLAGLIVLPVGTDGSIVLSNTFGSVHLVVDVLGYFTTRGGTGLQTVPSLRVLDGVSSPMAGEETRTIDVAAHLGLPASAVSGAVVNVTIAGAAGRNSVQLSPTGTAPTTSTVNALDRPMVNRSFVAAKDGKIDIRNLGSDAAVFVDIVGYFTADGARYTAVPQQRVLDTRFGPGRQGPLAQQEQRQLTTGGLPAGATAFGVLTSDRSTAPSYLLMWATGGAGAVAADLYPNPGVAVANSVLFDAGSAQIFNGIGATDVIVDLLGYFD